ncbi:hypothetical protein HNO89_002192 [Sporosarcina luteola]|nr:hypothetical protein [Sporosarcina luteola]
MMGVPNSDRHFSFVNQVGSCPVEQAVNQPLMIWSCQPGFQLEPNQRNGKTPARPFLLTMDGNCRENHPIMMPGLLCVPRSIWLAVFLSAVASRSLQLNMQS